MKIESTPIGFVRSGRSDQSDDHWGEVRATLELDTTLFSGDALTGLDEFSHIEVLFYFHEVNPQSIEFGARNPRGNKSWPRVGIFAQRGKHRPNRIGLSTCRLLAVTGTILQVVGLDAIDGTPILDIKPHMSSFYPKGEVREPDWVSELMENYWE
ncbi:SAM-dependent methyltransferase [bacterium]|nr:SAM-dependent methyltransferase [bacterium]